MNLGIKAKFKQIFWILFSIAVGIFLTFYAIKIINQKYQIETIKHEIIGNPKNNTPEAFYFIKNPEKKPDIKAQAYFVGDLDTGEVILQKNSDKKFPIASVTKLFTATTSIENQKQDSITKISPRALATEGENGPGRLALGGTSAPTSLPSTETASIEIPTGPKRWAKRFWIER